MNIIKDIARAILKEELESYNLNLVKYMEENKELNTKLYNLTYSDPKEEYYNNKYPKLDKKYYKQLLGKKKSFDVRCFCGNYINIDLPKFTGTQDEIAIKALTWIIENKSYKSDSKTSGLTEYWNMSYESLLVNDMDCEDGAILLYDILRYNNVPAWKLRITCGYAVNPFTSKVDGHAYLNYYSREFDKWVALDWCYLPNLEPMETQPHYKDVGFYGDVWWSFNENYCWGENK